MSQPIRLAILLAFAAVPLIEIGLLIRTGQAIGFWRLALLVVATAILGTIVIRRVGLAMFAKVIQGTETGRDGLEPVVDGFLQVTAGMLLIFPGFISDAIGLALLVPPVRHRLIASGLLKVFGPTVFEAEAARQRADTRKAAPHGAHWPDGDTGNQTITIEGEYERLSEENVRPQSSVRRQGRTK